MDILIVDDEQIALTSVRRVLKRHGFSKVRLCSKGAEAIQLIKEHDYDLVLLDLLMPEVDGMQVLKAAKPYRPATEFIILTAVDDLNSAVKAIRLGAYDYLIKPVDNQKLILTIERAFERRGLLHGLAGVASSPVAVDKELPEAFSQITTKCPRMKELLAYTAIMAGSGNPIMITGESGTGKELLAKAVHDAGPQPDGPFVPVNVSSIPDSMFESLFFGHSKGAFTGADKEHRGFFEQANGGTLFLDEIGELPINLQPVFLRVLDEKIITRLGETTPCHLNFRIVSATNIDMDEACRNRAFRLDLLYRLKSAHINLPPLREREGDIALLASFFLKESGRRHNKFVAEISPEALKLLSKEKFPGNIRELAQIIERAVLLCNSPVILPHHLDLAQVEKTNFSRSLCTLKENTDIHFIYVLTEVKGDRNQAAEILDVSLRHVQRKLVELKENPQLKLLLRDI